MSDKVAFVDYQDALSIKVGKFILSKGFDLASSTGLACLLAESNQFGILLKDPNARPRTYFFGLIKHQPRRIFIGTVWFKNGPRDANEQSWFFEIYGRKHVELLRQLAEEMATTFNVNINLRLVREDQLVETYLSDYGD